MLHLFPIPLSRLWSLPNSWIAGVYAPAIGGDGQELGDVTDHVGACDRPPPCATRPIRPSTSRWGEATGEDAQPQRASLPRDWPPPGRQIRLWQGAANGLNRARLVRARARARARSRRIGRYGAYGLHRGEGTGKKTSQHARRRGSWTIGINRGVGTAGRTAAGRGGRVRGGRTAEDCETVRSNPGAPIAGHGRIVTGA